MNDDHISQQNLAYIERVHAEYTRDPNSVSQEWRNYFDSLLAEALQAAVFPRNGEKRNPEFDIAAVQDRVDQLVRAYRVRGHMIAQLDPLGSPRPSHPELDPEYYGFTETDFDRMVSTRTVGGGDRQTIREILERLRNTYCRSIGVQFMHIDDLEIRHWLQNRMEGSQNRIELTQQEQVRILTMLTRAVVLEEFIRKKYVGAKSFSLDGCDSLIPLLDIAFEKAGEHDIDEIVLAMAHRGRLNVLVNVIGKRAQDVFREFEDADPEEKMGRGDVKYHLGHSSDRILSTGKKLHLSLCFNPSHLEYVNPVALGRVRAKQDYHGDAARSRALALMIHGDAAFAGEGIIQETLNLSELAGYCTGGAVHVIVNNQIGFTTSPTEARSSMYASGVAKMLQIPIFHVNGEDPEGVAQVVHVAMDFRQQFRRDVLIEMYGYRRLGHNETDEPSYTQPLLYRAIQERKPVRDGYLENMLQLRGVTVEQADQIAEECREELTRDLAAARGDNHSTSASTGRGIWEGYVGGPATNAEDVSTSVPAEELSTLLNKLATLPTSFHLHPKLEKLMERRREMANRERPIDWATAESLAFASLASQGCTVRLTGQDCERGTFSQRHAFFHDFENGERYSPLQHLAENLAPVMIHNSPLSEAGVLGFEYGYSLDCPNGLVLWEAQYGDFVNAAQVIIDQFIASGEDKWQRLSGVTLLLPHGLDGQGPEHSSARLERFLALAADDNIQIMNLTTPAQYFHALRRQAIRYWRKPLVIMTPKSLLRHPQVLSEIDELSSGGFQNVLPDGYSTKKCCRILICSGKIYYELLAEREELKRQDVAIIRLEQIYPFPAEELRGVLETYPDETPAYWVQEEPENMGAWRFLRCRIGKRLFDRWPFAGIYRPAAASPASGSNRSHKIEQEQLLALAFGKSIDGNALKAGKTPRAPARKPKLVSKKAVKKRVAKKAVRRR